MPAQKAAAAKKAHAFKGGAYKLFAAAKWAETLAECSGVTGVTAVAQRLRVQWTHLPTEEKAVR